MDAAGWSFSRKHLCMASANQVMALSLHKDPTIPKVSHCSDLVLARVLTVLQRLIKPTLESGCRVVREGGLTHDVIGFKIYKNLLGLNAFSGFELGGEVQGWRGVG